MATRATRDEWDGTQPDQGPMFRGLRPLDRPKAHRSALVVLDGGRQDDEDEVTDEESESQREKDSEKRPDAFDQNLVDNIDDMDRFLIGQRLREFYDVDIGSREQWERKMEQGLEMLGLDEVPIERTAFEGASQVNHPALAEAMVQFQARAMEELLPPTGPVKCIIAGKETDDREEQRERVEDYMNYQLTEEDDQYYWETDSMLFYLPYAGSAFKKVATCPITGLTRSRFVRGVDFVVPYSATSLKSAPRYSHVYTMPENDYRRAVDNGYFLDAPLSRTSVEDTEGNQHRVIEDQADDRDANSHPDDIVYTFVETHIGWHFDWEKQGGKKKYKKPYVITWEYSTGQVVRVQRLWAEDDPKCEKEVWFVHYKYLPGLGFYGFGLLHMIGSLGKAASGALRAVLDGSMTASLQGGFKARDARIAGDFIFQPGVWQDVDMTAEELAKSFYTPPFKEPSPALFNTLELLVDGIQRFASTTEAMVGEGPSNGPVGTTVALIEQGSKIFSGIHRRLHLAARQEFKLISESNYRYMPSDEYPYDVAGEPRKVFREDFNGTIKIIPVSDPNIFSSTQRIAISQAVLQAIGQAPDVFDRKSKVQAFENFFKSLKVPQWEDYFPDVTDRHMDPVTENQSMLGGMSAKAFADQDHQAHIAVHANLVTEIQSLAQQNPQIAQKLLPVIEAHIVEHYAWNYRLRISRELEQKTGIPLPLEDPTEVRHWQPLPINIENAIAQAVAKFVAPPMPAPPAQPNDPKMAEAQAKIRRDDMLAQGKARREDALAQAAIRRKDIEKGADLRRNGYIPDTQSPLMASAMQGTPALTQGASPMPTR
jgi:chaperonin GroES